MPRHLRFYASCGNGLRGGGAAWRLAERHTRDTGETSFGGWSRVLGQKVSESLVGGGVRLTQNMLKSFAQSEREIIGEPIRDKIAASRQRGQRTGGRPIGRLTQNNHGLTWRDDSARLI